jgi:murein DD-endopeptidase MepM/ murein hydrolase activator NlpD
MNIIVFTKASNRPLRINLGKNRLGALLVAGMTLAGLVAGGVGYLVGDRLGGQQKQMSSNLEALKLELTQQNLTIANLLEGNENHMNALALRLGEIQARALRLEALGERLTLIGQLDEGEFDFRNAPAVGGPIELADSNDLGRIDLELETAKLGRRIANQTVQLSVLETLIANRELDRALEPAGRPVNKGWLSSGYGKRADPFTAQPAMHYGIDFSGARNSNILAVAGGVVTWSGVRNGYGRTVDIDHGNGYMTRYAHNETNAVSVGDRVTAGDAIALMGSSGRATSTHVHFEVWYEGRRTNPTEVIKAIR